VSTPATSTTLDAYIKGAKVGGTEGVYEAASSDLTAAELDQLAAYLLERDPKWKRPKAKLALIKSDPAAEIVTTTRSLEENEVIIGQGIATFIEVGIALAEIRDGRLYLETHSTFEDYCRVRWDLGRSRAYQLIDSAAVSTIADIPNEAVARAAAPLKDDPEALRAAMAEAEADAGGKAPTAKQVRNAVQKRKPAKSKPAPTPSIPVLVTFARQIANLTHNIEALPLVNAAYALTADQLAEVKAALNGPRKVLAKITAAEKAKS